MVSLLTWAGAALLVTAGLVQVLSPPRIPPDFGSVPESVVAPAARVAPGTVPTAAGRAPAATSTGSAKRRSRTVTVAGVPVPAGRTAPVALALDGHPPAPVVPVGQSKGHLDVPEAVQTLGWWTGGAGLEAGYGSIVVTGHVDSRTQGIGYLAALRDVAAGQRITLTAADGTRATFVVTGRRAYRKAQGLPATVFDQSVQRRLVLITCTGAFDAKAGRYEDNLVVYAVPVGAPAVPATTSAATVTPAATPPAGADAAGPSPVASTSEPE